MENKLRELNEAFETFAIILNAEREIILNNNINPARDFVQDYSETRIEIEEKSIIIQFLAFIKIETVNDLDRLKEDKDLEKFLLEKTNRFKDKNHYDKFMESINSWLLRVRPL